MELLLVRHAIAAAADGPGREADARRPLTSKGRRRMRRGARGLAALAGPVELVATSPLVRAVETAEIVADALGADLEEMAAAAPGANPDAAVAWMRERRFPGAIALVGHEPGLSRLAALLLGGGRRPALSFKKGGACLLELPGEVQPGGARLRWLATAGMLRALGDG
jgi:phosphohistidine phosphatase